MNGINTINKAQIKKLNRISFFDAKTRVVITSTINSDKKRIICIGEIIRNNFF